MSREIGAAPQTIENYFKILEDTLLEFFLPCFHTSRRKQELSSKKFYLFDNGVIRALNRQLDLKINPGTSDFGLAFEHLIIQEFYRLSSYSDKDELLYFYKTQGGLEVDLIIDSPGKALLAIEIKSATRTTEDDIKHLKLFKQIDQKAKPILISRDPARKKIGDIICLPYQEALELFWQGTLHEV